MKIVIIGPVYPYKGGISHYTGLMAKHLSKTNDVKVVSFKLQYPKLLYKKPQKDYKNDSFKYDNSEFILNTINPLSALSAARYIKKQSPDLVIFQWWHPFFSLCYNIILKSLNKKTKVIFLCHNVLPHEGFPMSKFLTKKVLKRCDAYIVHSSADEEDLKAIIKTPVYKKTMHPTYDVFNMNTISKDSARELLSIKDSDEVLLFFGFIREYKGLKHLIRAIPLILANHPNTLLLIVGDYFENNKDEYLELIEAAGCGDSVRIVDAYIPDKQVGKYFAACDLVVCPYESATQSGIVQIAYGFEKPVVATAVGGLPEVVIDGQTGYLVPPCDSRALAEAIIRFIGEPDKERFAENIRFEADKYSWDRLVEVVEELGSRELGSRS